MLPDWYKYRTHCDIIGASQTGKTMFATYCRRLHIIAGNPIVSLDYKSGGFEQDCAFMAEFDNPVEIIDLAGDVPYCPFYLPGEKKDRNLSAHVSRLSEVILKTVSGQPLSELQNYASVAEAFFAYLATSEEPIYEAMRLFDDPKLWRFISVPEQYQREARRISKCTPRDWNFEVGALRRRLRPFVTSDALRKMRKGIDLRACFRNGVSVLINATPDGDYLSPESAQIFLGLIISELLSVALAHATDPRPCLVYCDEIQEYAPPDLGPTLDLVLASGMRFTTLHHFGGQVDERSQQSLEMNARIKIIFGGLPPELLKHYALLAYLPWLNQRMHKQARVSYVNAYDVDEVESVTDGAFGTSITKSSRLTPNPQQVETGFDDYSLDEKLLMAAEKLCLPNQHATAILPDKTFQFGVPNLVRYLYKSPKCLQFIKSHVHPYATQPIRRQKKASDGSAE